MKRLDLMNDPEMVWIVGTLLLLGGVFYLVSRLEQRRAARFVGSFKGDPELSAEMRGVWQGIAVRHRDPHLPTVAEPTHHGRNKVPYWRVRVAGVGLGSETSLRLAVEGVFGHLREAIGLHDIQVGIAEFDRQFTVRGDDPNRIRRALADPALRDAIAAFFAPSPVDRCRLDRDGELEVELRRCSRGLDAAECREVIRRTRALALALGRAAR